MLPIDFEPAFQALAKGASAIEALRMIKPMAPPRPAVGGDKILLDALLQGLSQQGMKYQPASDQREPMRLHMAKKVTKAGRVLLVSPMIVA